MEVPSYGALNEVERIANVINNINGNGTRRVDLVAGISYGDNMAKAKEILYGILREHPKVLEDPAPTVAVHELGDSSVNLVVRPWVNAEDYWDVRVIVNFDFSFGVRSLL